MNQRVVDRRVTHRGTDEFRHVGKGSRSFLGKSIDFYEPYGRATQEVPVDGDESGL